MPPNVANTTNGTKPAFNRRRGGVTPPYAERDAALPFPMFSNSNLKTPKLCTLHYALCTSDGSGASRGPPPTGCFPRDIHQISHVPRESKRCVYDVFPSWRKTGGNGIQEYAIYAAFSVQPHGKNKGQGAIAPCLLFFGNPCRWVRGVQWPPPTAELRRAA